MKLNKTNKNKKIFIVHFLTSKILPTFKQHMDINELTE